MSDELPALFGWDLLYGNVQNDIKVNQDVLVCFVHLVLVTKGFKCIGTGGSKVFDGSETKSESLPKGWNDDYALRYVFQGKLYNLKGLKIGDGIIINLIRVDELLISIVQLNDGMVAKRSGILNEMIPGNKKLLDVIKTQLIDKIMTSKKTRDTGSQTVDEVPEYISPHSLSRPINPRRGVRGIGSFMYPMGAVGVGGADLSPFWMDPLGMPQFGRPDYGNGEMLFIPSGDQILSPGMPTWGYQEVRYPREQDFNPFDHPMPVDFRDLGLAIAPAMMRCPHQSSIHNRFM